MDLHDPMIRVSTIKGKGPLRHLQSRAVASLGLFQNRAVASLDLFQSRALLPTSYNQGHWYAC